MGHHLLRFLTLNKGLSVLAVFLLRIHDQSFIFVKCEELVTEVFPEGFDLHCDALPLHDNEEAIARIALPSAVVWMIIQFNTVILAKKNIESIDSIMSMSNSTNRLFPQTIGLGETRWLQQLFVFG